MVVMVMVMAITVILRGNDGDSGGDVVVMMVVTAMVLLMVMVMVTAITVILRGKDGDSGGDVVVVMVVTAMVLLMVRRACFCIGAYDTQLEPKPYDNGDTMSGDEGDGYSDVAGIWGSFLQLLLSLKH